MPFSVLLVRMLDAIPISSRENIDIILYSLHEYPFAFRDIIDFFLNKQRFRESIGKSGHFWFEEVVFMQLK